MKLNNKGFAVSTTIYLILVLIIILITVTLGILSSRKIILDKQKKEVLDNIYSPKYYLIYDNNGGSGCVKQQVYYDKEIGEMCIPTRPGYEFLGWYNEEYKNSPLNYYADTYSDLYNAFGYNAEALYNHYEFNGLGEGRRISQYLSADKYTKKNNTTVYAGWYKNLNCSISVSSNTHYILNDLDWYGIGSGNTVTLTLNKSSKVVEYGITSSNVPTYNNKNSLVINSKTTSSGLTYYGYVKDNYGNTATCSKNIGIYDVNDKPEIVDWTWEIDNGNKCCIAYLYTYLGSDGGKNMPYTYEWVKTDQASDVRAAGVKMHLCTSGNTLTVYNIKAIDAFGRNSTTISSFTIDNRNQNCSIN